eukprot:COSAG06_NODE_3726_length_4971_cov_20.589901_4_plen_87_part_00
MSKLACSILRAGFVASAPGHWSSALARTRCSSYPVGDCDLHAGQMDLLVTFSSLHCRKAWDSRFFVRGPFLASPSRQTESPLVEVG